MKEKEDPMTDTHTPGKRTEPYDPRNPWEDLWIGQKVKAICYPIMAFGLGYILGVGGYGRGGIFSGLDRWIREDLLNFPY